MFARLTRFEGSEPAKLKQELGEMRDQMQRGLSDESIDQMAEQVKGQFERDGSRDCCGRSSGRSCSRTRRRAAQRWCSSVRPKKTRAASTGSSTRCCPARAAETPERGYLRGLDRSDVPT